MAIRAARSTADDVTVEPSPPRWSRPCAVETPAANNLAPTEDPPEDSVAAQRPAAVTSHVVIDATPRTATITIAETTSPGQFDGVLDRGTYRAVVSAPG